MHFNTNQINQFLQQINPNQKMTAKDVANDMNCSLSTARRYLNDIKQTFNPPCGFVTKRLYNKYLNAS